METSKAKRRRRDVELDSLGRLPQWLAEAIRVSIRERAQELTLVADIKRLRAEQTDLIAEMEREARCDANAGRNQAAVATEYWLAKLKRLQGEP
jgi:hypothetical protein